MVTRLPNASQQASADATVDRLDAGTGAGKVELRTGAQPADADTAAPGTLLLSFPLPDPAYGDADGTGAAALSAPIQATGVGAGIAGWGRAYNGDDAPVFDFACRADADPDNGEELVLDNANVAVGQDVTINTLSYVQPASE